MILAHAIIPLFASTSKKHCYAHLRSTKTTLSKVTSGQGNKLPQIVVYNNYFDCCRHTQQTFSSLKHGKTTDLGYLKI